jgi:hypothetical protein
MKKIRLISITWRNSLENGLCVDGISNPIKFIIRIFNPIDLENSQFCILNF